MFDSALGKYLCRYVASRDRNNFLCYSNLVYFYCTKFQGFFAKCIVHNICRNLKQFFSSNQVLLLSKGTLKFNS